MTSPSLSPENINSKIRQEKMKTKTGLKSVNGHVSSRHSDWKKMTHKPNRNKRTKNSRVSSRNDIS